MEITVKGTQRETIISLEKLVAHQKTIEHWLNGADVEEHEGSMWVPTADSPDFLVNSEYRAVYITPKAGEVWTDNSLCYLATSAKTFISLSGDTVIDSFNDNWPKHLTYSSPSIDAHIAHGLLKHGPDTAIRFFEYVKETAERTN
ncbi:hypothetical protein WN093_12170 [Gammaproteobacteria bacterium AS21]